MTKVHTCTHTHVNKKLIKAVDGLLEVVTAQPSVGERIASCSTAKAWDNAPPATPYFDYEKLKKRAKKNGKEIAKVFKGWKSRFNENYEAAQNLSPVQRFIRAEEPFALEVWEEIVLADVAVSSELTEVLIRIANEELLVTAEEVSQNLYKLKGIVTEGTITPEEDVLQFLEAYEFNLSEQTAAQVDQRLKSIVLNGMAEGKSNYNIAKDIRAHFDTLSTKKATLISRTETIRASAEGSKTAYTRAGIEKVAVLPALTACPVCIEIASNNPYDTKDPRAYAPFHPNCRCTAIPVFDETDVEAITSGIVEPSSF